MSESYPFEKRGWYPHMMPEDVAVWNRFIEKFPASYERCEYDVAVGAVPDYVKADPEANVATMERLYKKKIDVVAFQGSDVDIIELKPACTMSTIGQVKGYKHLYLRDVAPNSSPFAVVICGAASEDVIEFARNEDVRVIVV